jgi:hypothetical protein
MTIGRRRWERGEERGRAPSTTIYHEESSFFSHLKEKL